MDMPDERAFPSVYPYETRAGTRWYYSFRDARGRQSKRRGFTSAEAADAARQETLEAVGQGRVLVSNCRFDTWFHLWFSARKDRLPEKTRKTHARHGRSHFRWFAGRQLSAITRDDVAAWLYDLYASGVPPTRANSAHRALMDCLDDAVVARRIGSNPAREVPPLREPARTGRPRVARRRAVRRGQEV